MSTITLPASEISISKIREFYQLAANEAELSAEKKYAVLTAVEEAVWNIIEHSYTGDESGLIVCKAEYSPNGLIITLIDHGNPMPPEKVPNRKWFLNANPQKLDGMGLYLMFQLMDDVQFDFSKPGENVLIMQKRIS